MPRPVRISDTDMFEELTKYVPVFREGGFGKFVSNRTGDGTPERPFSFPYVAYSSSVTDYLHDLYAFCDSHPEFEHTAYRRTLEENGLEWGMDSMSGADAGRLDAKCVIALLIGAVRADRFSEGTLLELLEDGSVLRWLERLKELEPGEG